MRELISKFKLYLCPAGDGVYTVHTASDKKNFIQKKYFPKNDRSIRQQWEEAIDTSISKNEVFMLGVPSDCGGGIHRGANWGPLFLRKTIIETKATEAYFDLGDVRVIPHLLSDTYLNEETIMSARQALYNSKSIQLPVSPLSITYDATATLYKAKPNAKIFMIGGDHSVSYPAVKSYLENRAETSHAAVIHFDAHTDLMEERLGIDLCFATWARKILPYLKSPKHLVQIGIRSSGQTKKYWEGLTGVKQIWSDEIKSRGAIPMAQEIIDHLKSLGVSEIYISFDIDVLDQSYAGATGTPEKNGLSPHEPMAIMQELFEHFQITGADMVEIAPFVYNSNTEPETTLMTATMISTFLIEALHGNSTL